jgi:hypothetical protein
MLPGERENLVVAPNFKNPARSDRYRLSEPPGGRASALAGPLPSPNLPVQQNQVSSANGRL